MGWRERISSAILSDLLLVQSFRDTDERTAVSFEADAVELADILHSKEFLPTARFDVGFEEEWTRSVLRKVVAVRATRETKHQSVFVRHDAEGRTTPRVRRVRAMRKVDKVPATDDVNSGGPPRGQQQELVLDNH